MAPKGKIAGITIEIGGDTTKLDKALQGANKQTRDTQKELKEVNKLLKLDPKNTELLAQKQKLLAESIDGTKEKLNILKDAEKTGSTAIRKRRSIRRTVQSVATRNHSDRTTVEKPEKTGRRQQRRTG